MNEKTELMDPDKRMPMDVIKQALRKNPRIYGSPNYTTYLADRLDDELSPRGFRLQADKIIREMITGESSDPTKPVPIDLYVYAKKLGGFLITDLGIELAQNYCPSNFAKAVRKLHREIYLE